MGPAVVNHRSITRVIDVYANVTLGHDGGTVLAGCEKRLGAHEGHGLVREVTSRGVRHRINGDEAGKGYRMTLEGEMKTLGSAAEELATGLIISIVLIYLAMVGQFRSLLDPFVILLSVPLGFVGVVVALNPCGSALSIPVFIGVIMMTGTVVESTVILVDSADRNLNENSSWTVRDAIVSASTTRLRPILMASSTTVLAILPMALGFGGGKANAPLALT